MEEMELFSSLVKKTKGEPFDCINKFNLPILNVLWRIIVGARFDYDDEALLSITQRITLMMRRIAERKNYLALLFPWITKIYPKFMDRYKTLELVRDVINLMEKHIQDHAEVLDMNDSRDFIDSALIEIRNTTDTSSSFYGEKGKLNLSHTLFDLFLAGSETTSTTLTWAMLYMAK